MKIMRLALCALPFASRVKGNAVRLLSADMRLEAGFPGKSTRRVRVVLQDKGHPLWTVRTPAPDREGAARAERDAARAVRAAASRREAARHRVPADVRGMAECLAGLRALPRARQAPWSVRNGPPRRRWPLRPRQRVRDDDRAEHARCLRERAAPMSGALPPGTGPSAGPKARRVIRIPHFAGPRSKKSRFASEGATDLPRFSHRRPRQHA